MDEVAETAKENAIGKILDILVQTRKRTARTGKKMVLQICSAITEPGKNAE